MSNSQPESTSKERIQDKILKHLEMTGEFTALIAAKEYGTNDLRDQIYFLRRRLASERKGRWIKTVFRKSPINGERYAKYILMGPTGPVVKRSCQC